MPIAQDVLFSDLDFDLAPTADSDVSEEFQLEAIKQSLTSILNTNPGERVMRPDFGIPLRNFLFEPFDSITANLLGNIILHNLETFEPRVGIIEVAVNVNHRLEQFDVLIRYVVRNLQQIDTLNIILHRLG